MVVTWMDGLNKEERELIQQFDSNRVTAWKNLKYILHLQIHTTKRSLVATGYIADECHYNLSLHVIIPYFLFWFFSVQMKIIGEQKHCGAQYKGSLFWFVRLYIEQQPEGGEGGQSDAGTCIHAGTAHFLERAVLLTLRHCIVLK